MKKKNKVEIIIDKYRQMPVALRASLFFVFTGVLKDAVDVLSTPIFTRMLTTDEYGLFSVYNSWYQIIRIIVSLYIFGDGFTVGMARFGKEREKYASSQQGLATTLFLIWMVFFSVFHSKLEAVLGLSGSYIVLMLFQVLFTTAFNSWQSKKKYLYEYQTLSFVIIFYTILQPLLGIILITMNKSGENNGAIRIWSGVLVQIVFGVIVYIVQFFKEPTFFNKKYWSFSIRTNSVLIPHYMSQVILNQSDKLMIDYYIGKTQTAIYSVAHSAAFALSVVTLNLNSTFVPWLYEKLKKKDTTGVKELMNLLLLFSCFCTSVLVLVAPELMSLFAGSAYQEGKWVIPPLTVSVFFVSFYTLFTNVELFYGRNAYVMYISVLGGILNIILNFVMIPRFGYFAAGYTTLLGYIIMGIGHCLYTKLTCKSCGVSFKELYDMHILLAICLLTLVIGIISMMLYKWVIIRYLVLVVELSVVFLKRKKFIYYYKKMKS